MSRLYLGLVLHNHQPVGNYDFVIEQVYEQAYGPMLEALERHPGVRVAMHTSGCLFDWIAARRPEYMTRLRALCERGQVEMVTGGYYEPILPMIPDADKVGQIRKLSGYIAERFGQEPRGLWLTERVWEPGLPAPLADAGVRWTLVDDAHFRMAGLREDQLDGYYVTEDQGKPVKIFAGSQRLRYTIPWAPVEDVIAELRQIAETSTSDAPYVLLGDDGEKFGAWPGTHDHVWNDGWLERFFSAIEAEGDWLELMTPGAYAERFDARGLVYLPTASYAEMMEWAMPAEAAAEYHRLTERVAAEGRGDIARYLRGGFWRYFLAKYPEANAMHKRGLRIDEKLERAGSAEARDALWQAQCNCPYWHGVFGGLYLRHIRAATNSNLVRAERLADEAAAATRAATTARVARAAKRAGVATTARVVRVATATTATAVTTATGVATTTGASGVRASERDFDFDGQDDLLVQSPDLSLLLHPKRGGMISEFDLRRRDHALLDVLARRREAYHEALVEGMRPEEAREASNIHGGVRVKEEGLAEALAFDRFRRGGLQEWVLDEDATVEGFARAAVATSFAPEGAWAHRVIEAEGGIVVRMERAAGGLAMSKQVEVPVRGETIAVRYECTNTGAEARGGLFVSEWNLSAPQAPDGDDRIAEMMIDGRAVDLTAAAGVEAGVRSFDVRGSARYGLRCEVDGECDAWHFPVESVSSSEGGLERVAQGVSVSLVRRLDLAPGESLRLGFTWRAVEDAG